MFHVILFQIKKSRPWLHRTLYSHAVGAIPNMKIEIPLFVDYSHQYNVILDMNIYIIKFILIYIQPSVRTVFFILKENYLKKGCFFNCKETYYLLR